MLPTMPGAAFASAGGLLLQAQRIVAVKITEASMMTNRKVGIYFMDFSCGLNEF